MSININCHVTLSCWLSMQILLGPQRHKSDNSFAGAHCDVIFVGLLVMAWMGESLWVGLWVVLWKEEEGGGRIEEDDIVFPPLWSLFGGDVIVEGHVIFVCPAGLNVTPNITSPLPKAFLTLWHAQESSCIADWDSEEGTMETVSLSSSINKWSGMESWRDNQKI